MWYTAHIIVYIKLLSTQQETFPVMENLVLIEAETPEEGLKEAERIGRIEYDEDPTTTTTKWNEQPAYWIFGGVRKLVECQNSFEHSKVDTRPAHGTELTYSWLLASSQEELEKLIKGEAATLTYEEM